MIFKQNNLEVKTYTEKGLFDNSLCGQLTSSTLQPLDANPFNLLLHSFIQQLC